MATFLLLHGAWHDPSCWEPVIERLGSLGHTAIAPDLPLHEPGAGYAQRARPAIDALDGAEDGVIVVAHSQSSALGPLVAAARPVSALIYLCPRMGGLDPPPAAPDPFRPGVPFPPAEADGTMTWDPQVAIDAMYPRLAPDDAQSLVRRLRPMAMPPDDYPLKEHPDVPVELIYTTEDELFEPAFERFMAREALGIEPIELEAAGHFPMLEDPDAVAELLDRAARRREGEHRSSEARHRGGEASR